MSGPGTSQEDISKGAALDFACMGLIAALYFAYMLAAIWMPGWLGSPAFKGSVISVGLVLGLVLVVIIVISALAYDGLRRSQEKRASGVRDPMP